MRGRKLLGIATAMLLASRGVAADQAQINASISNGKSFLSSMLSQQSGPIKSLAAYALIKTGVDKSSKEIQEAVEQAAKAAADHYSPGMPRFGHEFAYTVPCHMFLLEAVDPVGYKAALEAMSSYLIEHQQGNGAWFYTEVPSPDACDTSQTQFALLGLWAASRAGIDVPSTTWEKGARFLLDTQREDGSFAYQPFSGAKESVFKDSRYSATVAAAGSLLLVRHILYPGTQFGDEVAEMSKPNKKHSVLERMPDEQGRSQSAAAVSITAAALDKGIAKALRVINLKFSTERPVPANFHMYLLYATERTAALLNSDMLGKHEWYTPASETLLRMQLANGSWSDASGDIPATCFGILCLTKATAKTLGKPPGKKVGGGLLAGARGLPDELSKLQMKDGQAVERKSKGDVDNLLAELENTQNVDVADVQQAILESVNLDDKDQLVGQLDRLRRLAADPRAEVRRTALWAIGRSREIRLAPLLISGLNDVDMDVIREASFGLTVLSRKPTGLVDDKNSPVPVEPLDGLNEDASDEARQKHLEQWLAVAVPAWKKWYFSVRPYDERDDRQTLQKKR